MTLNVPAKDIEKLGAEMARDKQLSHDIEVLAKAWRTAAVAQVGEVRYKQLSEKLGGDLAMAYVNHRLTMRMVDYEVEKTPIKGSVDYILDEAHRSSLLSFVSAPTTQLQQYIDKKIVEQYNPGLLEKGAGKALGSLTDLTLTLPVTGVSSFAGLSKFVAVDLGLGLAGDALMGKSGQQMDVSQMVSAALFSSDVDVLSEARKETRGVNPYSSEVVKATDSQLGKKIVHHSASLFDAKELKPKLGLGVLLNCLKYLIMLPIYVVQVKCTSPFVSILIIRRLPKNRNRNVTFLKMCSLPPSPCSNSMRHKMGTFLYQAGEEFSILSD